MSALDDAIAAELSHPAGACADPLTDSLASQAGAAQTPALRAGWEHEPIEVPVPWRLLALVVLLSALAFSLAGCSTVPAVREPSPKLLASCPPLSDPPRRNDADAQTRRIAELESWYSFCREAALGEAHTMFTPEAARIHFSGGWGLR